MTLGEQCYKRCLWGIWQNLRVCSLTHVCGALCGWTNHSLAARGTYMDVSQKLHILKVWEVKNWEENSVGWEEAAYAIHSQTGLESTAVATSENIGNISVIVTPRSQDRAAPLRRKNRNGAKKRKAKKERERGISKSLNVISPNLRICSETLAGEISSDRHTSVKCYEGSQDTRLSHKVSKRFRPQETGNYADDPLARVVVAVDYPKVMLSVEQLMLLKGAISKEIDEIREEPLPRFRDAFLKEGAVIVKGADEASLDWLTEQIKNISPWEGVRLKVMGVELLRKRYKAVMWVPGPPENCAMIFSRLERQNPGLSTLSWRVYAENVAVTPEGRNVILSLLEPSVLELRALDFKLYFGLGQVTIRMDKAQI